MRELRNVIERAVILARGPEVHEQDIVLPAMPGAVAPQPPSFFSVALDPSGTPPALDEVERAYVLRVLEHLEGRRMQAASVLGISYPTFLKQLRRSEEDSPAASTVALSSGRAQEG